MFSKIRDWRDRRRARRILSHIVWHLHGSPDHNASKIVFDVFYTFFDDGTGLLPLPSSEIRLRLRMQKNELDN
jgi:hypothetical protein